MLYASWSCVTKYIYVYNGYVFLIYWPLLENIPLLGTPFVLKSGFLWYQCGHSSSLRVAVMINLFPSFYLQPTCFFESWVYLLYTACSWILFLTQFDSLYLSIGLFNPFTFSVIINMVGCTSAILLLVFWVIFWFLFSSFAPSFALSEYFLMYHFHFLNDCFHYAFWIIFLVVALVFTIYILIYQLYTNLDFRETFYGVVLPFSPSWAVVTRITSSCATDPVVHCYHHYFIHFYVFWRRWESKYKFIELATWIILFTISGFLHLFYGFKLPFGLISLFQDFFLPTQLLCAVVIYITLRYRPSDRTVYMSFYTTWIKEENVHLHCLL